MIADERREIVRLRDEEGLTWAEIGKRLDRDPKTCSYWYRVEKGVTPEPGGPEPEEPTQPQGLEEKSLTEMHELFRHRLNLFQKVNHLRDSIRTEIETLEGLGGYLAEFGIVPGDEYTSVIGELRFLEEKCLAPDPYKPGENPAGTITSFEQFQELEAIYGPTKQRADRVWDQLWPKVKKAKEQKEERERVAREVQEGQKRVRSLNLLMEAQRIANFRLDALCMDVWDVLIFENVDQALDYVRLVQFFFSRMPAPLTVQQRYSLTCTFMEIVKKHGQRAAKQWIENTFPPPAPPVQLLWLPQWSQSQW